MKTHIIVVLAIVIATSTFAEQVLYCSGTVRYPTGAPAAGVRVEYYPGHYPDAGDYTEVKSDAKGHYAVIQPKKVTVTWFGGFSLTNSIMARDLERNLAAIQEFAGTPTNIDLILQPAIYVTGSVKNTEGAPVNDAEVELGFASGDSCALLEPRPKANAQGSFSIPVLPRGRGYIIQGITAKGYGSCFAVVETTNTQTNRYEFPALVLNHADRILAGRVLDINGKPLAGVELKFSSDGEPGQPKDLVAKSDSEGKFVFDEVCEGKVMVSSVWTDPATKLLSQIGEVRSIQAGDTNIVISLHAFNK